MKKFFTLMVIITMYFGGGLIADLLLVRGIEIYDTRWALILPGAIATWNMIVMRTAFNILPASLEESAKIDGANDFTIMLRIMLPLVQAIIAVITLFYVIEHWNSWMPGHHLSQKKGTVPAPGNITGDSNRQLYHQRQPFGGSERGRRGTAHPGNN